MLNVSFFQSFIVSKIVYIYIFTSIPVIVYILKRNNAIKLFSSHMFSNIKNCSKHC